MLRNREGEGNKKKWQGKIERVEGEKKEIVRKKTKRRKKGERIKERESNREIAVGGRERLRKLDCA